MYCVNCGAQLPENAAFCPVCGNQVQSPSFSAPNPEPQNVLSDAVSQNSVTQASNQTHACVSNRSETYTESSVKNDHYTSQSTVKCTCPKCGSENVKLLNDSNTEGSLYGTGKGCLGYLLLGPLGLLCGACGSKIRTSNSVFWACENCGETFRRNQDIDNDIAKVLTSKKKSNKRLIIVVAVLLLLYLFGAIIIPSFLGGQRSVPIPIYISFAVWIVIIFVIHLLSIKSYNNSLKQLYEEKNSLHNE